MKKLLAVLLFAMPAFAQGSFYQLTQPFPNGTLTVCPVGTANPCPSPSSIFSDAGLSVPVVQPVQLGPGGNYGFWVASGQYIVRIGQPYNASFNITMGGGGGGTGTVSANNGSAGAGAFYAAAGGSTTVGPLSGLTFDAVGNATLAQGSLAASTPAFSQTGTWNGGAVVFTNSTTNITCTAAAANSKLFDIQVGGASKLSYQAFGANCGTPVLLLADTAGQANLSAASNSIGLEFQASNVNVISNTTQAITFGRGNTSAGIITQVATGVVQWVASGTSVSGTVDLGLSRDAANVLDVGSGAAANSAGVVKAAAFRAGGAAAGLTGTGACATFSGQVGGSNGGQAQCTAATAASTLTITPGTTAPNGWVCYVQDQTTRANLFQQTSNSATACTLTVTSATQNDVFVFTAFQF